MMSVITWRSNACRFQDWIICLLPTAKTNLSDCQWHLNPIDRFSMQATIAKIVQKYSCTFSGVAAKLIYTVDIVKCLDAHVTYHKLCSPVSSLLFVSTCNAEVIVEPFTRFNCGWHARFANNYHFLLTSSYSLYVVLKYNFQYKRRSSVGHLKELLSCGKQERYQA